MNVRVFEFDGPGGFTQADLQPVRDQLKAPQWKRIVIVQEGSELTEVWISQDATNNPNGLFILSAEENELTIVNVIGKIDLSNLGALGGQLGIPQMDVPNKKD